jgi:hypothetical protein
MILNSKNKAQNLEAKMTTQKKQKQNEVDSDDAAGMGNHIDW